MAVLPPVRPLCVHGCSTAARACVPACARAGCSFEEAVSLEYLGRSRKAGNAPMRARMDAPRLAKVYQISSTADPTPVEPPGPQDKARAASTLPTGYRHVPSHLPS